MRQLVRLAERLARVYLEGTRGHCEGAQGSPKAVLTT